MPIPIVFNLSSWGAGRTQSLAEWLVDQLKNKYSISGNIAQRWVKQNKLLLLLDGLDEVADESRAACVQAINEFTTESSKHVASLAVCSRTADYVALTNRLTIHRAVLVQPLERQQVDRYLEEAGQGLSALRNLLQEDDRDSASALWKLAHSPLTLRVMMLAYRGKPETELHASTLKISRQRLFDTFTKRMFKRDEKIDRRYSDQQTMRWLVWLAQRTMDQKEDTFLIENLQPSWLTSGLGRWIYLIGSRLLLGLTSGVIGGLVGGVTVMLKTTGSLEVGEALMWGLLGGLVGGLLGGLIDGARFEVTAVKAAFKQIPAGWRSASTLLLAWLIVGLTLLLMFGLVSGREVGLAVGFIWGLSAGQPFGLTFGLRKKREDLTQDIDPVEALRWVWTRALKGVVLGLVFGLIVGPIVWLLLGGWQSGLIVWAMLGLVGLTFGGLTGYIVKTKLRPNLGIHLALSNAIKSGRISGLAFGLFFGLLFGLKSALTADLSSSLRAGSIMGVLFGLTFGLIAAMRYGGFDVVQHCVLRLILWFRGHIPRNYAHFLDYCVDRIFLRRVGGGYIFIHRYLMEYFASLTEGEIERLSTEIETGKGQAA